MVRLLVIADDFTGALDTGVQFANLGIATQVTTQRQLEKIHLKKATEVLVVDTESRFLAPSQAYQRIREVLRSCQSLGYQYLYKKVDSALRGNVSAELKAVSDHFGQESIGFVPAFPDYKRSVRQGKLYIEEVLVSQSVFGHDPYEPVLEDDILLRLQNEAEIYGQLVDVNQDFVAAALYLFDGQDKEDLRRTYHWLEQKQLLHLTAGCAGFANVLAEELFTKRQHAKTCLCYPLVVICGSVNPITIQQIETASQQQAHRVALTSQQLLSQDFWEADEGKQTFKEIAQLLQQPKLLIFETYSQTSDLQEVAQHIGLKGEQIRFRIAQSLGKLTEKILSQNIQKTLFFTGGDTLHQSMEVLHVTDLTPREELSPGVVYSELVYKGQQLAVITKSGGFGSENLFIEIQQQIKHSKENDTYVS